MPARSVRRVSPIGTFIFALSAAAALVIPRAALAVHLDGIFELDGDAFDDPNVPGEDWSTTNAGLGSAFALTDGNVAGFPGVIADPAPKTIFTTGGSKDPNDLSSWRFKDGSAPDKDDITNAYAAAYKNGDGDMILYFGSDRFANDGDALLGFWFFQANVTLNNATGGFDGVHAPGDLLVLASFSQGGTIPTIQVLEWVGTKGATLKELVAPSQALCNPGDSSHPAGKEVCAITNSGTIPSIWPYTPKSGPGSFFPPQSFFEGGINLTKVFDGNGGGAVPCFTTFLAESRSSTSVTSTLKDFVRGSFPVCGISVTKTCDNPRLSTDGGKILYDVYGDVVNEGFGTVTGVSVVDDFDDQTLPLDGDSTLDPGETVGYSGTIETTLNGPDNTVTASASGTGGVTVEDATSEVAHCPPLDLNTGITVSKSCTVALEEQDPVIVLRIDVSGDVCNTGATTLTQVTVVDDQAGTLLSNETLSPQPTNGTSCKSYQGSYYPSAIPGGDTCPSNAEFGDTVEATGVGPVEVGTVSSGSVPATCKICPVGGCE